jgi:hypothetical protein
MPIPENTGLQDFETGHIYPKNLGTWANLASIREITISSNVTVSRSANIILGNVSFGNITIINTTLLANSNVIVMTTSTANIANISVGMQVYDANTVSGNTTVTSIRNSTSGITWASYTNWANDPAEFFLWNSPIIDNGSNKTFNCLVTTEATGTVSYQIRSSITGNFDGTESLTTVTSGNVNIPAYEGQFVVVTANVVSTTELARLTSMDVIVTDETIQLTTNKLDTSTLSGTSSSRQLNLGRNVSYINNLQMSPYLYGGSSPYVTVGYVTADYFPETIVTGAFPQIVDKLNGGANIAIIDNDGNYIDGNVDVLVYALPEQYVDGNNIKQR